MHCALIIQHYLKKAVRCAWLVTCPIIFLLPCFFIFLNLVAKCRTCTSCCKKKWLIGLPHYQIPRNTAVCQSSFTTSATLLSCLRYHRDLSIRRPKCPRRYFV